MTTLLFIHVAMMTISLIVTTGALTFTVFKKHISKALLRSNLFVTITGLLTGVALLNAQTLTMRCIMLTSYLIAFSIAYKYITIQEKNFTSATNS